jgi:hypothetical protein
MLCRSTRRTIQDCCIRRQESAVSGRYAQYQWYRVAEAAFSNFMAGQRLPLK